MKLLGFMDLDLETQPELGKGYLGLTPKARPKVGELDLRNISHFHLVQDAWKRVKRQVLTGKGTREPHIR